MINLSYLDTLCCFLLFRDPGREVKAVGVPPLSLASLPALPFRVRDLKIERATECINAGSHKETLWMVSACGSRRLFQIGR